MSCTRPHRTTLRTRTARVAIGACALLVGGALAVG